MKKYENMNRKTEVQQNDEMTNIFNKHRQWIYFWAKRRLHNDYISEEIVQQVFLHLILLQRKGGLVVYDDGRLINLLLLMTNREVCNQIKRMQRTQDYIQWMDVEELEQQEAENEVVRLMTRMDYKEVISYISEMSETFSSVMYLRYVTESSVKEIAQCLNLSISTVEKRLERGRGLIRRYFKEFHPELFEEYDTNLMK